MEASVDVEFYKYRRKSAAGMLRLVFFILSTACSAILCQAEEVYQCNNQTQTCITESEQNNNVLSPEQQNDQQLFQLPSPLSSWVDVPQCRGKIMLSQFSGFISDGPGNYSLDTKCTWVVQSFVPNSTIRYVAQYLMITGLNVKLFPFPCAQAAAH